jgi:hypothetical protein
MKIITDNAAYLQKYYYGLLLESSAVTNVEVPISIRDTTTKKSFNIYDLDQKDFIKFTNNNAIEFLKKVSWIPDLNDYVDKTIDDIKEEIVSIDNEIKELDKWFENLSNKEQQEKHEYVSIKVRMLFFKKESLIEIITLKEKNLNLVLGKKNSIKKIKKILQK